MIKLDHKLLAQLGLGQLSTETKDSLLKHLYDKLELNVGTVIASQLSEQQLSQFEALIDDHKQAEALEWLQANYPDYKQVVEQQLELLKKELKASAKQIIESEKSL
ncbi:MAG TPA: DUF5663 domain-containing protein [Candidatus Saccharimonadales bacterium]